ncbi:MAG TPA: methyltransferase domain-containing protein [Acidiphilium sp.]|nr:MAG: methyltransferase type 11 [Acidiphilium sp. 21-60-14]OYV91409.1 MAG: methyltransferase type 11 [Acidiphilium sp. 37-60-79]OZB41403.1 MAG: methyltransferase type 11 [Acidiphilium sp. 34-60-192]HQT87258.1 methyltransferase domain-containing protein [Acidiphilium sp.]HQU23185.1 methyltransferase domain-containing protein [Acidiphilium sp.]
MNEKQIAYWNQIAGPKWVAMQAAMESRLAPVNTLLLAHAAPCAGETVLEIGCGTGTTTALLAAAVGPTGRVLAVDVSRPMLDAAGIELAAHSNVTLAEADAATHVFEPVYDLVVSRFGVMFFEDPIKAFTNIRKALKPGGRLCCTAWAPVDQNPHWSVTLQVAIAHLGAPKPRKLHAPGPLAFDDAEYVTALLTEAGFAMVAVQPIEFHLQGESLDREADIATKIGPSGALLDEKAADPAMRAELCAAFAQALAPITAPGVRLPATLHLITGHQARH